MDVTADMLDLLMADADSIMQHDGVAQPSRSMVKEHLKGLLAPLTEQVKKLKKKNAEQEDIISQQKNAIIQKDATISNLSAAVRDLSYNPSAHPPCIVGADPNTDREAEEPDPELDLGYQMPDNLENIIFRTHYQDHELDFQKLWIWVNRHFMKRLSNKYEWFALWRVLKDKGLIRNRMVSTRDFVRQMKAWFKDQDSECMCSDYNVNLYRSGYLGMTEYRDWCQETFEEQLEKKTKQRLDGYLRLSELCADMLQAFKITDFFKQE